MSRAYARFALAVVAVAAVALVDGYLYLSLGVDATISRFILWQSCLHPALPFALGGVATAFACRAPIARGWPVLAYLAGFLSAHFVWPQVITFR